jgi:hypothetical protein
MHTSIKELTARRTEMERMCTERNDLFNDTDFMNEIERVCGLLMVLNAQFQKETDRVVIEWDCFEGTQQDVALSYFNNLNNN